MENDEIPRNLPLFNLCLSIKGTPLNDLINKTLQIKFQFVQGLWIQSDFAQSLLPWISINLWAFFANEYSNFMFAKISIAYNVVLLSRQ